MVSLFNSVIETPDGIELSGGEYIGITYSVPDGKRLRIVMHLEDDDQGKV